MAPTTFGVQPLSVSHRHSQSRRPCPSSSARLWDRLLGAAESRPSPSSGVKERASRPHFTFTPRPIGDDHLRSSFERAVIYDGLQVVTNFDISVQPGTPSLIQEAQTKRLPSIHKNNTVTDQDVSNPEAHHIDDADKSLEVMPERIPCKLACPRPLSVPVSRLPPSDLPLIERKQDDLYHDIESSCGISVRERLKADREHVDHRKILDYSGSYRPPMSSFPTERRRLSKTANSLPSSPTPCAISLNGKDTANENARDEPAQANTIGIAESDDDDISIFAMRELLMHERPKITRRSKRARSLCATGTGVNRSSQNHIVRDIAMDECRRSSRRPFVQPGPIPHTPEISKRNVFVPPVDVLWIPKTADGDTTAEISKIDKLKNRAGTKSNIRDIDNDSNYLGDILVSQNRNSPSGQPRRRSRISRLERKTTRPSSVLSRNIECHLVNNQTVSDSEGESDIPLGPGGIRDGSIAFPGLKKRVGVKRRRNKSSMVDDDTVSSHSVELARSERSRRVRKRRKRSIRCHSSGSSDTDRRCKSGRNSSLNSPSCAPDCFPTKPSPSKRPKSAFSSSKYPISSIRNNPEVICISDGDDHGSCVPLAQLHPPVMGGSNGSSRNLQDDKLRKLTCLKKNVPVIVLSDDSDMRSLPAGEVLLNSLEHTNTSTTRNVHFKPQTTVQKGSVPHNRIIKGHRATSHIELNPGEESHENILGENHVNDKLKGNTVSLIDGETCPTRDKLVLRPKSLMERRAIDLPGSMFCTQALSESQNERTSTELQGKNCNNSLSAEIDGVVIGGKNDDRAIPNITQEFPISSRLGSSQVVNRKYMHDPSLLGNVFDRQQPTFHSGSSILEGGSIRLRLKLKSTTPWKEVKKSTAVVAQKRINPRRYPSLTKEHSGSLSRACSVSAYRALPLSSSGNSIEEDVNLAPNTVLPFSNLPSLNYGLVDRCHTGTEKTMNTGSSYNSLEKMPQQDEHPLRLNGLLTQPQLTSSSSLYLDSAPKMESYPLERNTLYTSHGPKISKKVYSPSEVGAATLYRGSHSHDMVGTVPERGGLLYGSEQILFQAQAPPVHEIASDGTESVTREGTTTSSGVSAVSDDKAAREKLGGESLPQFQLPQELTSENLNCLDNKYQVHKTGNLVSNERQEGCGKSSCVNSVIESKETVRDVLPAKKRSRNRAYGPKPAMAVMRDYLDAFFPDSDRIMLKIPLRKPSSLGTEHIAEVEITAVEESDQGFEKSSDCANRRDARVGSDVDSATQKSVRASQMVSGEAPKVALNPLSNCELSTSETAQPSLSLIRTENIRNILHEEQALLESSSGTSTTSGQEPFQCLSENPEVAMDDVQLMEPLSERNRDMLIEQVDDGCHNKCPSQEMLK